ncbi:MAG TPA: hypothetical protein VFK06_07380 [Candidatus Angelobacter sp.]|nr:hypothetical protein [Candidatus Angelobacter sp.]
MPAAERQAQFRNAVGNAVTVPIQASWNYGLSNGSRYVEGAFLAGRANLANGIAAQNEAFCLFSMLALSDEIEVHLAVTIRHDLPQLATRLQEMLDNQTQQIDHAVLGNIQPYSQENNNVSFYLASDGRLYTTSRQPVTLVDNELIDHLGHGLSVDHVYYAVHPATIGAKNHPSVTGLIQDLKARIGSDRVTELLVWTTQPSLIPTMFRMPHTIPLDDLVDGIAHLGGVYAPGIVDSFHSGLNFLPDKHFVILAGLSGTGKTSLVRRYALAVHGINSLEITDPLFFMCPVRPDWTDPTGLTGHFDVFTNCYIVPDFLRSVLMANAFPDCPVFVCMDELNLARVEYYFSDVLSAIETGLALTLHSHQVSVQSDMGVLIPPTIPWPHNLFIVGTVNVDETTHTISDKVLDRAVLVDLSNTDFATLFNNIGGESAAATWAVERCATLLTTVNNVMLPYGMGFGYRLANEVVRYHLFAVPNGNESRSVQVLDQQLVQKILVKLRGTERHREMLTSLLAAVNQYPRSTALVQRLIQDLAEGSFQATR